MGYIGAGISRFNTADELTVTGDAEFNGNANFGDSDKVSFSSGKLEMYHDGTNAYIDETYANGTFLIRGNNISLQKYTGETMIQCVSDGKVELNFNNVPKLETTSSGVGVTGDITLTSTDAGATEAPILDVYRNSASPADNDILGGTIFSGETSLSNKKTYAGINGYISNVANANASGGLIFNTRNVDTYAERMRLDSSGNLLIGKTADNVATVGIEARATGPLISTRDGSDALRLNRLNSDGEIIQLRKDGTTVGSIKAGNGDLLIGTGAVNLRFFDTTPAVIPRTAADGTSTGVVDLGNTSNKFKDGYFSGTLNSTFLQLGASGSAVYFEDTNYAIQGSANNGYLKFLTGGNERARFDNGSRFLVGQTSAAGIGTATDSNSLELGPGYIVINRDDTATATQLAFGKNGSVVGSVSTTGSGTTYNTTSDIRLKQDIEPLEATDKLMQMNPVSYSWKVDPDGPRSMGFIAQEMQEVMPEAVAVGDDEDAMMSMDYGRITPILVSALQDAHRKIDELAAEIAELKAS
jgi:hypothetical protein